MINSELKRDNHGKMHLFVGGQPALGAVVAGIDSLQDGKQYVRVLIPLDQLHFGEVTTVVPMVKRSG